MRRSFLRALAATPQDYRARFQLLKPSCHFRRHFLGAGGRACGGGAQARQDVLDAFGLENVDAQIRAG